MTENQKASAAGTHTPGPWAVCTAAPNDSWYVGRTIYCPAQERRVGDAGFFDPDDIALANARLMAAAPDMLALLQELIDIEGPQPGTSEWAGKVRAMIAKAAGRIP